MIDFQGIQIFLGSFINTMKKSKLVPRFKYERYSHMAFGIEFTMPWKHEGLGVGFGLGVFDLWFGWQRSEKSPRYDRFLDIFSVREQQPVR